MDESEEQNNINEKKSEIVIKKKSSYNKLIIGVLAVSVFAAFLGGYVLGSENTTSAFLKTLDALKSQQSTQATQAQQKPQTIFVSLDDDPVKGNPNAPITMIEFSDFQCPFCAKFHTTTLPQIQKNYIDPGKLKFVYRDLPIQSIHPNAVPAALAAECADDQGMFWQYHDKLFQNQVQWQNLDAINIANILKQYATEFDLEMSDFNECLDSAKHLDEINKDLLDGSSYGVTGTPGFFIGNEKIGFIKLSGAQPYSVFERAIEQQLAS